MATRRIMKKAATLLIPLANTTQHRNYASVIISTTPQLKKNLINSSSSNPRSISILCFSDLYKQGRGDDKVIVKTPREFPFIIEDKPGDATVTLTREYEWNHIRVVVHMPHHRSSITVDVNKEDKSDDESKSVLSDPQSSIRLVVTSTNYLGTTLEYGVIAYPDDFSIDSFCIKYANAPDEENIYYKGADYAKLDKNLQKEFKRRLKIRGIVPSTTKFLHEYMANREMYSSDSSSSPLTDQSTPESLLLPFLNDEGIPANPLTEQHRKDGHPLVSAEDIRNSGKKPKDFIWIAYPYHRTDKLLYIEIPSKGFFLSESELEDIELDDDSNLFLDGEALEVNPYRCIPRKAFGDPPIFSEEMDKILYPNLKRAFHHNLALQPYYDAINEILRLRRRGDGISNRWDKMSAEEREWYQFYCM